MRNVEWTPEAEFQFYDILEYWIKNNGSDTYSKKIYLEVDKMEKILKISPFIGQEHEQNTKYSKIRKLVILSHFSILYRVTDIIQIVSFWDNRKDPQELKNIF